VVWQLGNAGYGVWSVLTSLTGYLSRLDLGVRGAVTRDIASFHTHADHHRSGQARCSSNPMKSTSPVLQLASAEDLE